MYCINCNKEVDKEAKACPYCGTDFTEKPKPAKEKGNHNCECHDCKCNNCDCNDKKATNATLVGVLIVVLLLLLGLAAIATIVIGGSYIFRKDEKNNHEQKEVKDGRIQLAEPEEGYTGVDIGYCFELDYYAKDEHFIPKEIKCQ